jgi:adhesin/invasin
LKQQYKILMLAVSFTYVHLASASTIFQDTDYLKKLSAEVAKNAAENSANPESSIVSFLKTEVLQKTYRSLETGFSNLFDSADANSELTIEGADSSKSSFTLSTVQGLGELSNGKLDFFQGSFMAKKNRDTVNLGFGRRFLSDDESWIYGINVFYDYEIKYGHQRASIGGEMKNAAFEITANKYVAISGWEKGLNDIQEHTLGGYEIEVGGQVPYIPTARIFAKSWNWDGKKGADTKGRTYSLQLAAPVTPNMMLEAGRKDFDNAKDIDFINVTYKFRLGEIDKVINDAPFISKEAFASTSMKAHLLDKVRRKNNIVVESGFTNAAGGI